MMPMMMLRTMAVVVIVAAELLAFHAVSFDFPDFLHWILRGFYKETGVHNIKNKTNVTSVTLLAQALILRACTDSSHDGDEGLESKDGDEGLESKDGDEGLESKEGHEGDERRGGVQDGNECHEGHERHEGDGLESKEGHEDDEGHADDGHESKERGAGSEERRRGGRAGARRGRGAEAAAGQAGTERDATVDPGVAVRQRRRRLGDQWNHHPLGQHASHRAHAVIEPVDGDAAEATTRTIEPVRFGSFLSCEAHLLHHSGVYTK